MSIISGAEFKRQYQHKFVKIVPEITIDNTLKNIIPPNYRYKHGLNEDIKSKLLNGYLSSGFGFDFIIEDFIGCFLFPNSFVVNVSIPDDAQVYIDSHVKSFKSDKIILDLDNKILLKNYPGLYESIMNNLDSIDKKGLNYLLENAKEKITSDICFTAVDNQPSSLEIVPKKFINYKLCKCSVKYDGYALEYVPIKYRKYKLCKIAVKNHGLALKYVPKKILTDEICEIAVKNHGLALKYIPKKMLTDELCKIAVNNDINALEYVPKEILTN